MAHTKGLWILHSLASMILGAAVAAPSLNASSLSLPYNAPPANTNLTASPQNSPTKYVYGNCANATALSTAYVTSSYHNTIIVSIIAPSATCCTKCEIGADRVQLVYWQPEQTTSASDYQTTPYTLVSDNYTFTSPSVYVIYHTLLADYTCDENQAVADIGPQYDAVTIGYPPDALSTGVCYHTNWMAINYTELYYPPPDYEVITQAACSMSVGDPRTVDSLPILAGSPIFSIPDDVSQVNPLWRSCTPAAPGGYDPPRALTKIQNLVPTPAPPPVSQAKPEPSATLQLAAETGAPGTPNGASAENVPQDPSNPSGTNNQGSSASSPPGAESGGDSGSTTGKQNNNAGSQQAPDAKVNQPDPQNPSTSNVPSLGNGESSGSSPPDDSGNVEPGSSEGSKENGADPSSPSVPDDPGSASKGEPDSNSPGYNSNGGDIGVSLQEAPGGGLQLGTVTIAPGAQTTHSGHIFSVGSSFVLVDGSSFDLQSSPAGTPGSPSTSSLSQQDSVGGGGVVMGTMTFPSGAQTTYSSGHTISVGSSIFAVDGSSYKEVAGGGLIFGTSTLPPGSQVTESGHVISVGSSSVVIDGTSYTWAAGASSPTPADDNLGGLIMSAFGTGAAATSSSSPLAFTGDAARSRPGLLAATMAMMASCIMYICIL